MNKDFIEDLGKRGETLLAKNISPDEEIGIKLKGTHGEGFVVTNKRVYILKWGFSTGNTFGGRCNGFEFTNIVSVEFRKGLLTGTIEVLTPATQNAQRSAWNFSNNSAPMSDNVVTITRDKFDISQEVVRVSREIIAKGNRVNEVGAKKPEKEDTVALLEKLAELKEKGIITEEEFKAKKKKVLDI